MVEKLQGLLKNSYSPYSNFAVSAVVEMNDGTAFNGVNVENASYGATICAERNAINSAIAAGYTKGDFKTLNIMVSSKNISTPCLICRQTINEFFCDDCLVHCYNINGDKKTYTVGSLCPYPFTEGDLK